MYAAARGGVNAIGVVTSFTANPVHTTTFSIARMEVSSRNGPKTPACIAMTPGSGVVAVRNVFGMRLLRGL